jgi:hypothetical protein
VEGKKDLIWRGMSQKLRGTEYSLSRNMPIAQLAHLRLGAETRVTMLVLPAMQPTRKSMGPEILRRYVLDLRVWISLLDLLRRFSDEIS